MYNKRQEIILDFIQDNPKLRVTNLHVTTGIRDAMLGIVGTNYKPLDNKYQIR